MPSEQRGDADHERAQQPRSRRDDHRRRKTRRPGATARRSSSDVVSGADGVVDYVVDESGLQRVCAAAAESGMYALDTEFHREKTYYPQLALLQLGWHDSRGGGRALIDPLVIDQQVLASTLRELLESPAVALIHAASQDLEILENLTGTRPREIIDTQLAAGFVGYSTPSLSTLTQSLLGVSLAKGERLTDWLARPLTANQRLYAINDVDHLHAIYSELSRRLQERGRADWARDSCEELRTRASLETDPETAWLRIKEARPLRGEALGAAQALAAWRERKAQQSDVPPRRVLSDITLVGIAQRLPQSLSDLDGLRGGHSGNLGGERGRELLEIVGRGRQNTVVQPSHDGKRPALNRSVVLIVSAWIGELARREEIDPSLLATRDDVEKLLSGAPSPLAKGWRSHLVGADLSALVSGKATVGVDPEGNLVLHHL